MKIKPLFALFALLVLTTFSTAQGGAVSALQGSLVDAVGLPGQGWTSIGNVSPIEHNNFYLQSQIISIVSIKSMSLSMSSMLCLQNRLQVLLDRHRNPVRIIP